MTPDICYMLLVFAYVRQNFGTIREHVRRFYGHCQTLSLKLNFNVLKLSDSRLILCFACDNLIS